jgi:adenine-specific DNA-methyltransferase
MEEYLAEIEISSIYVPPDRYRKLFEDIEALAENIADIGLIHPIIVVKSDNRFTLEDGERRLRAHKYLNLTSIKAIVKPRAAVESSIIEIISNLPQYRKGFEWKEYVLAMEDLHQKMSAIRPGWSMRKTASEVGLSKSGVIGDIELAKALKDTPDIFSGIDSKRGAIKALQQFKIDETMAEISLRRSKTDYGKSAKKCIFLGDCLNLITSIPDEVVHAVITDPPYGIDIDKKKQFSEGSAALRDVIYKDNETDYFDLISKLIPHLYRSLKPNGWILIFCGNEPHLTQFIIDELKANKFHPDPIPGIWYKTGTAGQVNHPEIHFARVYENFIYAHKGNPSLIRGGTPNLIPYPVVPASMKDHRVEKPVGLLEELISRFCLPGQLVLDPFAGSGSTLVAAIKKSCQPIGFELDPRSYDIALMNVSEALKMKDAGKMELI